ncbi:hypothetical protein RB5572 [Rhodopirellula baltica SH 1]|uniref:Uncharacterized protein n=1 Tax=Rhodopirellula baltica (strain DSM 10527 / NCIMB 13988 / SH1) TaxID=243090 RepID=Q7URM3_RHOBA|nr:hypothetical protein RB5572 [Rhodopirellula baltica SH 1]
MAVRSRRPQRQSGSWFTEPFQRSPRFHHHRTGLTPKRLT